MTDIPLVSTCHPGVPAGRDLLSRATPATVSSQLPLSILSALSGCRVFIRNYA